MNLIQKRICALREEMTKRHIDYVYVVTSDCHQSEYVDGHFKAREFISGFTGSNGDVLIGQDIAILWTDGRYYIQAEKELFETEIKLRKALIYPPYCDICVIGFVGENEYAVKTASQDVLEQLKKYVKNEFVGEKIITLGPMPSRLAKINEKYRYRLIIKCVNSKRFREMIFEIEGDIVKSVKIVGGCARKYFRAFKLN